MTLAPGVQVTPNVRLVSLLGQGGMGSVWLADHLTLHTQVAVKFISAEFATSQEAVARFSREATAAAKIKSPYVVQIFDHGVFDGVPYIVMELLEGEDLEHRIERLGPLSLGDVGEILQQVGRALSQAHGLGIVHRDIKPANVFLTSAGGDTVVKLLDFGIAKSSGPPGADAYKTTQTGQILGTPCYLSPEQVFSSKGTLDYRTDLWALAVLTYEALTGDIPFKGGTLGDIFLAIHQRVFEPVCAKTPSFPTELDAFFLRAFAASPADRFGSARELADAFLAIARVAPGARAAPPFGALGGGPIPAAVLPTGAQVSALPTSGSAALGPLPVADARATFGGTLGPVAIAPAKKGRATLVLGAVAGAAVSFAVLAAFVFRGAGPERATAPLDGVAASGPKPGAALSPSSLTSATSATVPAEAPQVIPSATVDTATAPPASAATAPSSSTAPAAKPMASDARPRPEPRSTAAPAKPAATGVKRHDHGF